MIRYITYFYSHEAQLDKFQIGISLDFKLIQNFLQSVITICSFFYHTTSRRSALYKVDLCGKILRFEFSVLNNSLRPKMSCLKYEVT